MNPFLQLFQRLASGAGAGAGNPLGMLGGAGAAGGAPAAGAPATPSAPQGMLGRIGLTPDRGQFLMNMGAGMMQAGAPSLDPKSGSFLNAVGAGFDHATSAGREDRDSKTRNAYTQALTGLRKVDANNLRQTMANEQQDRDRRQQFFQAGQAQPTNPGQAILASGPKVGAVEDGYRFLGGDPTNPNSWEAVR